MRRTEFSCYGLDECIVCPGRSIYNYSFAITIKSKLVITLWVNKQNATRVIVSAALWRTHIPSVSPDLIRIRTSPSTLNEEGEEMLLAGEYCDS